MCEEKDGYRRGCKRKKMRTEKDTRDKDVCRKRYRKKNAWRKYMRGSLPMLAWYMLIACPVSPYVCPSLPTHAHLCPNTHVSRGKRSFSLTQNSPNSPSSYYISTMATRNTGLVTLWEMTLKRPSFHPIDVSAGPGSQRSETCSGTFMAAMYHEPVTDRSSITH